MPHLILWPYAHVGILVFSTTLSGKNIGVEDLMNFNYLFRKTDKSTIGCLFPLDSMRTKIEVLIKSDSSALEDRIRKGINESLVDLNDSLWVMGRNETNMQSVVTTLYYPEIFNLYDAIDTIERTLIEKRNELQKREKTIAVVEKEKLELYGQALAAKDKEIQRHRNKYSGAEKKIKELEAEIAICKDRLTGLYQKVDDKLILLGFPPVNGTDIRKIENWNSASLLNFLFDVLKPDGAKLISLHNKLRIHLITYYQIAEKYMEAEPDLVLQDFIRISRGENRKYMVRCVDTESSSLLFRPFDNFLSSSSVEGCALLTLKPKEKSDYFESFETGIFCQKYLWIYFWIVLQRHSQLYWIQCLTRQSDADGPKALKDLTDLTYHVQRIKACSYFTDISDFTHHNQFCQFCKKNLCIGEHFKEIEEKLIPLYSFIRSKEVEEERQKEKEAEKREREQDKRKEDRENIFGLIVALLAITSVVNDGADYFTKHIYDFDKPSPINWWGVGISLAVSLVIFCFWYGFYKKER